MWSLSGHVLNVHMHKIGPRDPSIMFMATNFTQKMPESSGSMHSFILMLENILFRDFTRNGPNSQKIYEFILIKFGSPRTHNWNKIHNFLWIWSTSCKIMMSYASNTKKEEYMEFEHSVIFQIKLVTKNILPGSMGTQSQAVFAMWCLFLKKHTYFLNQTVTLKCLAC